MNLLQALQANRCDLYYLILNLMQSSGGALNFNDALIALVCREQQVPAIASFEVIKVEDRQHSYG